MGSVTYKGNVYEYLVDQEDLPLVVEYKWHYHQGYARAYSGEVDSNSKVLMHRLILGLTDKTVHVDHINRNRLDNRKSNLRITTRTDNCLNRGPCCTSISKVRNVYPSSRSKGKFEVTCKYQGKPVYLGTYDTIEEAETVAVSFRKQYHSVLTLEDQEVTVPVIDFTQMLHDNSYSRRSSSGRKNVWYDKHRGKWVGCVSLKGTTYRKRFPTQEDAENYIIMVKGAANE